MTPRVMACFSALVALLSATIATWLAMRGQALERPALWYWIAAGIGWVLVAIFVRAAIIGKLPKWFEAFLDAQ